MTRSGRKCRKSIFSKIRKFQQFTRKSVRKLIINYPFTNPKQYDSINKP